MGISMPMPSVMRERPIMSRKPRHSMTMVGCRSIKAIRAPLVRSMKPTATMTAIYMTVRW